MSSFDELHGLRNGVAKLETEIEELRRTLRLTQGTSPGSHAAPKILAEIQHYETIRNGMLHELSLHEAALWRSFGERFMDLAREEQGRADVVTEGRVLGSMYNVLRAKFSYQKHPDGHEVGKPEQGCISLLDTPPHGAWWYDSGGVSENLLEQVRARVTEAGRALPDYTNGTDPEDFWLDRLYLDLLKSKSDLLYGTKLGKTLRLVPSIPTSSWRSRQHRSQSAD